jgi:hypothetical protein
MNGLVKYLSAGEHPVEVTLRPEKTSQYVRRRTHEVIAPDVIRPFGP